MTRIQAILLVALCVAMLGAMASAHVGFKRMCALGPAVASRQRTVVFWSLVASAFLLLSTAASLMATLQHEPPVEGNWSSFLFSFALTAMATSMSSAIIWSQTRSA